MTMPGGNDLLMQKGYPSVKFAQPGASVDGRVLAAPRSIQKRHPQTKEPMFWPDGNPQLQVVVDLATDQYDPNDPTDDGLRTLYLGSKKILAAVRGAVAAAGAKGLEPNGRLYVKYTHDGAPPVRQGGTGGFPPKEYEARYQAPGSTADAFASVAADPDVIPEAPAGMNAEQWRALDDEARQRVLAALANRR